MLPNTPEAMKVYSPPSSAEPRQFTQCSGMVPLEHSPELRSGYPHRILNELNFFLYKHIGLAKESSRKCPGMALAG